MAKFYLLIHPERGGFEEKSPEGYNESHERSEWDLKNPEGDFYRIPRNRDELVVYSMTTRISRALMYNLPPPTLWPFALDSEQISPAQSIEFRKLNV